MHCEGSVWGILYSLYDNQGNPISRYTLSLYPHGVVRCILFHTVVCAQLHVSSESSSSLCPSLSPSSFCPSLPTSLLSLSLPSFPTPLLSSSEIGAAAGICWKLGNGIHFVCSKWSCKPLHQEPSCSDCCIVHPVVIPDSVWVLIALPFSVRYTQD